MGSNGHSEVITQLFISYKYAYSITIPWFGILRYVFVISLYKRM